MMRTLASFPDLVRQVLVHEDSDPTCGHIEVYAPCCGRRTAADSILDVRDVPTTIVRGGNFLPPRDHGWLCDGCRQLLYIDPSNEWTRSRLYSAVGSDPEHVRRLHANELLAQVQYWDHATMRGHDATAAIEVILASLPPGDPHRRER